MIPRFLYILVLLIGFTACDSQRQVKDKRQITVSIPPQKFLVEQIAGPHFEVSVLLGPGMGPETYEPSPTDMKRVSESVLYFLSGHLDFENILAGRIRAQSGGPAVIDCSENVNLIGDASHQHDDHSDSGCDHAGIDPHYWVSPREVKTAAHTVYQALLSADPLHSDDYTANYERFLQQLDSLDHTLTEIFADVKSRHFIVYHPSLGYLARDYQLQQVSLELDGKTPSARHMATLVDVARRENISTVFVQSQFDNHNMETLAKELSGKVVSIDPLSGDWLQNLISMAEKLKMAMNGT